MLVKQLAPYQKTAVAEPGEWPGEPPSPFFLDQAEVRRPEG